ncbi:MAG: SulP family inorganic anion transporter [Mariniblastus sp.]
MISDIKHWKSDVPSGLVVFLVAIPLCLGIALASGASAMSGIIAGIVGGLVVTLFSNSPLGVSGPAAGLVAIVAPAINQLGFQNFLLAVVFAGVIQFILGVLKAGTIGYYFPTSVIKGMLAAIGLIIILKQIPHAFGYDKDFEGDLAFQQADGYNTFSEIGHAMELITPAAVIITVVCLAILILWETKFMKSFSFSKIIQGPLVAVIAGIVLNLCFNSVESLKLDKDHLVQLPASIQFTYPHFSPSTIKSGEMQFGHGSSESDHSHEDPAALALEQAETKLKSLEALVGNMSAESQKDQLEPALASLRETLIPSDSAEADSEESGGVTPFRAAMMILVTALTLAIVASLESLLCAEATDKLDPQRRQTDLNQELRAQGIGNFVSGLVGGLPVTQVIVRSSTNIQSGAQSRLAAFVHGVFLIVCVVAIPSVLNLIPFASLAAILFVVGYKLAHPSKFKAMFDQGWTQFLPFIITIAAILRTDLLIGIGIGLIASLFFILKSSYFKSFWITTEEKNGKQVHLMTLAERVFFINKGTIQNALKDIKPGSKLIIDASNTVHVDQDVADVFEDFYTHAKFENIEVERIDCMLNGEDPARVRDISSTDLAS